MTSAEKQQMAADARVALRNKIAGKNQRTRLARRAMEDFRAVVLTIDQDTIEDHPDTETPWWREMIIISRLCGSHLKAQRLKRTIPADVEP